MYACMYVCVNIYLCVRACVCTCVPVPGQCPGANTRPRGCRAPLTCRRPGQRHRGIKRNKRRKTSFPRWDETTFLPFLCTSPSLYSLFSSPSPSSPSPDSYLLSPFFFVPASPAFHLPSLPSIFVSFLSFFLPTLTFPSPLSLIPSFHSPSIHPFLSLSLSLLFSFPTFSPFFLHQPLPFPSVSIFPSVSPPLPSSLSFSLYPSIHPSLLFPLPPTFHPSLLPTISYLPLHSPPTPPSPPSPPRPPQTRRSFSSGHPIGQCVRGKETPSPRSRELLQQERLKEKRMKSKKQIMDIKKERKNEGRNYTRAKENVRKRSTKIKWLGW